MILQAVLRYAAKSAPVIGGIVGALISFGLSVSLPDGVLEWLMIFHSDIPILVIVVVMVLGAWGGSRLGKHSPLALYVATAASRWP